MPSVLVTYGPSEPQTEKVARRVADVLAGRGYDVTMLDLGTDGAAPSEFDAVVVGASIHLGDHQSAVTAFVSDHREALAAVPSAFFQLSLSSAAAADQPSAEAAGYVEEFVAETGWNPDRIGLFGGALHYSEYGFFKRLLMKRIAKDATGDVDTSRDYEYTDWDEVDAFSTDFAAFVESRPGIEPPSTNP